MANTRVPNYKDTGLKLKSIREELHFTMDEISKELVMSRSYISDFERGYRLPTSKYLKFLHDKHNVNVNYVFGSEGRKFRPTPDEKSPDFGMFQEEVDKLLRFMSEIPHALYAVLGFFTEYKLMNKELIERHRNEKGEKGKNED